MKIFQKIVLKLFFNKALYKFVRNLNSENIEYLNLSFAQEGEDIVLARIFDLINKGQKYKGFYVDIGAHHPIRFSNTYRFYREGWIGINADPLPGTKNIFDKIRTRDINLEIAVSNNESFMTYYMFNEPALNTFEYKTVENLLKKTNYKLIEKKEVKTKSLKNILNEYLPQNQEIDLLTIDVEGFDTEVLESNDWNKYNPKVIVVEKRSSSINESFLRSDMYELLQSKGYYLFSKLFNSNIFIHQSVRIDDQ